MRYSSAKAAKVLCLVILSPLVAVQAGPTSNVFSTTNAPRSNATAPANAKYWFSFGDSYTQSGFNPSGTLPSVGNALGNPSYPGYTATGGENWVDYVTTKYNKSLLLTYNYAYGGATIDAKLVPPFSSTVLSLTDQVNQFLRGAGTKPASTPWSSSNSLFSVFIGINDIGNSWYQSGDRDAYVSNIVETQVVMIEAGLGFRMFYSTHTSLSFKSFNVGARNFLFVNVPPIDRSPLMLAQSQSNRDTESRVINNFNAKLLAKINSFKASNSGVSTYVWDSHSQFATILNSPTSYGFKDATSYGSSANQFWGNNYHPSSYAHKFFGQQVGNVVLGNTVF